MHIRGPFKFAHVDVASPHVLLLDVLPGPVDVHAVRGHGGGFGRSRFYSINSAAGARGVAPSAAEARGLYGRAIKPVGLDAAGLGVASADRKRAS